MDTRLEPYVTCRKMHEPAHIADFQRENAKKDHFYDVEAFDEVEDTLRRIDNEIGKIRDKVLRDAEGQQDSQDFMKSQRIFELNEKIGQTLVRVEELGGEGKVEESLELTKQVEDMKKKKRDLESELRAANPTQQRLRVCEECGAQLNILDHETRLQDHYGGKMHLGMVEIRAWYSDMKTKIQARRDEKRAAEGASGSSRRSRTRSRSRSPDRTSGSYERRDRYSSSNDRRDDRGDRRRDDRRDRYNDRDDYRHRERYGDRDRRRRY